MNIVRSLLILFTKIRKQYAVAYMKKLNLNNRKIVFIHNLIYSHIYQASSSNIINNISIIKVLCF